MKKEEKIKNNQNEKNTSEDNIETLKEKISELEKQLEEKNSDYLRALADYENYKKRTFSEISNARDKAIINFVENLLPSIDNFEMSLKMTENQNMLIKGVEMIHKNLLELLKENKIEEFEPKIGENFDPFKHDPIMIEDETKNPGEIKSILKKGYSYKDKIVRPAKVEVVKEN